MKPRQLKQNERKLSGGLQSLSPKTIAAIALMTAMAVLWGRVLFRGKGGPATANAQEMAALQEAAAQAASKPEKVCIQKIELPMLPGRNDALSYNIFSADHWTAFEFHRTEEVVPVPVETTPVVEDTEEKRHSANLQRISGRLTLEGVICDADQQPVQAFVENKILSVGALLTVQEGPDKYDLKLEKLENTEAVFTWNTHRIVLKMADLVEP